MLIEAQLADCLNLTDPRDRGIGMMNICISQSLSRAHIVLFTDVLYSSLTEFFQSDKRLCSFVYLAVILIYNLAIKSTKIELNLVSGLK